MIIDRSRKVCVEKRNFGQILFTIRHFSNEKRTGTEMFPAIVSGIVTGNTHLTGGITSSIPWCIAFPICRKFSWHHHLIYLLASRGFKALLNTVPGESASVLQNCHMYLHCISKENFITRPRDISCVELLFPEVHVSFMDKMAERRVALLPSKFYFLSLRSECFKWPSQHGRFVFFSKYSSICVIENKLRFDSKNDSYISKTMQSISVRSLLPCMLTPCLQFL